ncbi:MAG TPA: MYXO-CTERM sorting domain-containing protein [Myxococcaceae bacterium]|nr:MYXO-CTERM sorting domain-containing protein [Myxococcaceae bacterium]
MMKSVSRVLGLVCGLLSLVAFAAPPCAITSEPARAGVSAIMAGWGDRNWEKKEPPPQPYEFCSQCWNNPEACQLYTPDSFGGCCERCAEVGCAANFPAFHALCFPPQETDGGTEVDGGVPNEEVDAGTPDAGTDGADGGTPEPDGGTGGADAGTPEPDGGTDGVDAGTAEPDGGTDGVDAGTPDAGTAADGGQDGGGGIAPNPPLRDQIRFVGGGCSCGEGTQAALTFGMLGALALAARRRHRRDRDQ